MEPKTMPASWSQATEALGWTSQKANVLCTFSTLLLCAWTHPHYYRIRLASLFRIPLTVITVLWWSHCLFNRNPAAERATGNLGHLLGCYLLITKSLDWGFFSGPQDIRSYVVENQVGEWRWESTRGKSKAEHGLLGFILHQVIS
ncbi:hypothetical protein O181_002109 [Austropuccinia psidii MF-1]|uniref:Uncharacterized protein n=1 Tax=Austropuccinia psidii MF-1 TaxID=1389203 RepID=A0A9Q3BBT1_9BASI|nr:hypothetical protein [Austropuccinia psidii MF-1]